jgi:hypothetical protein
MTPIKLVHTKRDVPKYGASSLDPDSSKIITDIPQTKTMISNEYFFIFFLPPNNIPQEFIITQLKMPMINWNLTLL